MLDPTWLHCKDGKWAGRRKAFTQGSLWAGSKHSSHKIDLSAATSCAFPNQILLLTLSYAQKARLQKNVAFEPTTLHITVDTRPSESWPEQSCARKRMWMENTSGFWSSKMVGKHNIKKSTNCSPKADDQKQPGLVQEAVDDALFLHGSQNESF